MKNYIKSILFTNELVEFFLIKLGFIHPFFTKFYPNNSQYTKGTIRNAIRGNVSFELDISDYQEYLVYFNLDSDTSKHLLKYIPFAIGTVLDIGANIGQTSLWIASSQKDNNKIIAFEPFPSTFVKLKKNIELNKFNNIILENLALSECDSVLIMVQDCATNSGGNKVFNPELHDKTYTIEVQQSKLDSYLKDKNEKIIFIKIDVEGYEYKVLLGAKETILKHNPILYIELCDNNLKIQGSCSTKVIELLKSYGYSYFYDIKTEQQLDFDQLNRFSTDILCKF